MMSIFWVLIYFSAVAAGSSVLAVEDWRKAFNDLIEGVSLTPNHFENFHPIFDVFVDFLDPEAVSGTKPVLLTDFARFFAYHVNCFDHKLPMFYRLASMGWDGYLDQETGESYIRCPNLLAYPEVIKGIYEMIPLDSNSLSSSQYSPLKIVLINGFIDTLGFLIFETGTDISGPVIAECLPIVAYNFRNRRRDLMLQSLSLLRVRFAETDTEIFRSKLAHIVKAENYLQVKELCLELGVPQQVFVDVELKHSVLNNISINENQSLIPSRL